MKSRVLIGPAPLKEILPIYGPMLAEAGYDVVFPPRKDALAEVQMTEPELATVLPGCIASLAGSEPYTRAIIEAASSAGLKVIARAGVGYDAVDLTAATDTGVAVTFAPGTNQDAVAEHTFMLMLALARFLIRQHTLIKEGEWPRRANLPLRGQTLGLVGLGRTGKAVAVRAIAFGMPVVAFDPYPDAAFASAHNIPLIPLDDVFRQSDFVSLHLPKSPESKHIVNRRTLGLMKPTAFLINTARGAVIDESDLYEALRDKRIAGAGLDVFDAEPPGANPILGLDNVVLTAHTAGVDFRSRDDMARAAAQAIIRLLNGDWPAEWVVNPAVKERFLAR